MGFMDNQSHRILTKLIKLYAVIVNPGISLIETVVCFNYFNSMSDCAAMFLRDRLQQYGGWNMWFCKLLRSKLHLYKFDSYMRLASDRWHDAMGCSVCRCYYCGRTFNGGCLTVQRRGVMLLLPVNENLLRIK